MAKSTLPQLSDENVIRIARQRVTESAASTFTQAEIDTQLSVERGVIWLIDFIEFNFEDIDNLDEVAAGGAEFISAQLTRTSQSAILDPNNADILQQAEVIMTRSAAIGTDSGPLYFQHVNPIRFDFPNMPIPYAAQSIFLGIKGSHASAKHNVTTRVGYHIASVTDKFFFRVAQSILA